MVFNVAHMRRKKMSVFSSKWFNLLVEPRHRWWWWLRHGSSCGNFHVVEVCIDENQYTTRCGIIFLSYWIAWGDSSCTIKIQTKSSTKYEMPGFSWRICTHWCSLLSVSQASDSRRSHFGPCQLSNVAFIKTHKTASTTLASVLYRYARRHDLKVWICIIKVRISTFWVLTFR